MTVTELLARDWTFEVNDGTVEVPDWVEIGGLNTWSHSPTANDADTTTFDDNGRLSHLKASRGDEFTFSGLYQEDPDTGDRDAGQAAAEAWAALVGHASTQQFRITSPGGNTLTFLATATVTSGGGGNDDAATWELAIVCSGALTNSSLPTLPGAPTSPTGTPGDDHFIATWTEGSGTGIDQYEVVAYNASAVLEVTVVSSSKPVYIPCSPDSVDYNFKVRAHNAAGWGDYSALSANINVT